MADDLYKAYDQKLVVQTPAAQANFNAQYGGNGGAVNAVGRAAGSDPHVTGPYDRFSPSGTDWNQTFRQNNPYSPSGTDWNKTFGQNLEGVKLAGNTTPPPSPGDIDNTFFGGGTPTPTPTPKPSLAYFRRRVSNSNFPLTTRDFEMYGAGADFGLT